MPVKVEIRTHLQRKDEQDEPQHFKNIHAAAMGIKRLTLKAMADMQTDHRMREIVLTVPSPEQLVDTDVPRELEKELTK